MCPSPPSKALLRAHSKNIWFKFLLICSNNWSLGLLSSRFLASPTADALKTKTWTLLPKWPFRGGLIGRPTGSCPDQAWNLLNISLHHVSLCPHANNFEMWRSLLKSVKLFLPPEPRQLKCRTSGNAEDTSFSLPTRTAWPVPTEAVSEAPSGEREKGVGGAPGEERGAGAGRSFVRFG